jgi:hypothetical protein
MPFGGGVTVIPPEQERRDRIHSEVEYSEYHLDVNIFIANTECQVSTLRWLQENTTVPIPRVFAYDDNPGNVVGAAYIIEERVSC